MSILPLLYQIYKDNYGTRQQWEEDAAPGQALSFAAQVDQLNDPAFSNATVVNPQTGEVMGTRGELWSKNLVNMRNQLPEKARNLVPQAMQAVGADRAERMAMENTEKARQGYLSTLPENLRAFGAFATGGEDQRKQAELVQGYAAPKIDYSFNAETGMLIPNRPGVEAQPVPSYTPPVDYEIKQDKLGNYIRIPKRPGADNSPTGVQGRAEGSSVSVNIDTGKREEGLIKPVIEKLPEQRDAAKLAVNGLGRVNNLIGILNKQGDKVTGISGQVRSAIAPFAATVGLNTEAMDDAQLLQAMTTEGAGSLRMAVVGPGPVSNYEQGILDKVSGRKMSSAEGLKRLLVYHRDKMKKDIQAYNEQVENVAQFPGYEGARRLYPQYEAPEDVGDEPINAAPPRQAKQGMKWQRNTRTGEYREVPIK